MVAQANGRLTTMNGSANGNAKGPNRYSARKEKPRRGFLAWSGGWALWLGTWYCILTALFRCPSTLEDVTEETSRVCAPYLAARSYAAPYVQPYYEKYVAPYQGAIEPHYRQFHSRVYTPALTYGQNAYEKHGAPQVERALDYTTVQWNSAIKPQLDTYTAQIQQQYNENLAPHIEKVAPYWDNTRTTAQDVYEGQILPAYAAVEPHINTALAQAQKYWEEIGYPAAAWAMQSSWNFVDRTIRPRIAVLYGENVQPQIDKITQRLGRYSDEQKLKSAVKENEEARSPEDPEGTHANPAHSAVSSDLLDDTTTSQSVATESPAAKADNEAEESVEDDLKKWRLSWEKAASRGTEDLQERVESIADSAIKTRIGSVGQALLVELEETASTETKRLKVAIRGIVKSVADSDEPLAAEDAESAVAKAARAAGSSIRARAQAIRVWHQDLVESTHELVAAAAINTLEVIDGIRDLGLQEIGMKWASLGDKVTYQDWQKYHQVKKDYGKTRKAIEDAALEHPLFSEAKAKAEDIEAQGMAIAEDAARELIRLKEVGLWKIQAVDDSDDFSTKVIPPKAKAAAKKISEAIEGASQSILGTTSEAAGIAEGIKDILRKAAATAESANSQLSEKVVGTEPGFAAKASQGVSEAVLGSNEPAVTSVVSVVKASAVSMADSVQDVVPDPEAIIDDATASAKSVISAVSETVVGSSQSVPASIAGQASASIKSAISQASEAAVGSSTPGYESIASKFSESAQSAASIASNGVVGSSSPAYESSASEVSQKVKSAISDASEAAIGRSTPAYESAAREATKVAASVADSVLSKASSSSESLQSAASSVVVGKQKPAHESAASWASEAIVGSETPSYQSVASQVVESVRSAASDASSAIIGSETPMYESVGSQASKSISSAISGASAGIVGRETPAYESVLSQVSGSASELSKAASSSLETASEAASSFGESVRSSASSVASAASKSATKVWGGAMAQQVEYQAPILEEGFDADDYKEKINSVLKDANSKYNEMTKAVSEALLKPTTTQGSVESLQNIVQERYASAMAAASQALYGEEPSAGEQVADAISSRYQEAVNAASFIFYGRPTGTAESVSMQARIKYAQATAAVQEQYEKALSLASAQISGTTEPAHQQILSSIQAGYSEGLNSASDRLSSALGAISSGIYGSQSPQESFYSVANDKYAQALAAANSQFDAARSAIGATPTPASEALLVEASSRFSSMVSVAQVHFTSAEAAANSQYGAAQSVLVSISAIASSRLADSVSYASEQFASARTAVEATPTPAHQQYIDDAQKRYYQGVGLAHERFSSFVSQASLAAYGTPTPAYQNLYYHASQAVFGTPAPELQQRFDSLTSAAASQYTNAVLGASIRAQELSEAAKSAVGASDKSPAESAYDAASSSFEFVRQEASKRLHQATEAASQQIYGTPEPAYQGYIDSAKSVYDQAISSASASLSSLASGTQSSNADSLLSQASVQYSSGVAAASASALSALSEASVAIYGPPSGSINSAVSVVSQQAQSFSDAASSAILGSTPAYESMIGRASANWEDLVAKASSKVYGEPAPWYENVYSQAGEYGAKATAQAAEQYAAIAGLLAEAVQGKEPAFTDSVMSRLSSAYYSGAPDAASSISSAFSEGYASASSIVSSAFVTPTARIDEIIERAGEQVNVAVNIASAQVYGTTPGYAEQAQSSIAAAASSAQAAISIAVYGSDAGAIASATNAAAAAADRVGSQVNEVAASISAKASEALYGPQQGAVESAQAKLFEAMRVARKRLEEMASYASEGASEAVSTASKAVEEMASNISSAAADATDKVKDEL